MITETLAAAKTDTEKLGFIQGTLMGLMLDTSNSETIRNQIEQAWKYSMEITHKVITGSNTNS